MAYDVLKILHLLGVVVLIGNVTVTSFWKVFADRTADPKIVAHAQKMVTITDWAFTASGIALLCIGGFGAAWVADIPAFSARWLVEAEILFGLSGAVWLTILLPIQWRQAKMARGFAQGGTIPDAYWRNGRLWLIWGIVATVPLVAAIYVMVAKS